LAEVAVSAASGSVAGDADPPWRSSLGDGAAGLNAAGYNVAVSKQATKATEELNDPEKSRLGFPSSLL
jgi:hypothetical protein